MSCLRLALLVLTLTCGLAAGAGAAQPADTQGPSAAPGHAAGTPDAPAPLEPGDAFGVEVTLPERPIVYLQGQTKWDNALATLMDAFKTLGDSMDKQGMTANGAPMAIFTEIDDAGFKFHAAAPLSEAPSDPLQGDIAIGRAPAGKALKFVHRGSYHAMDSTYEAITNHLDAKGLEARDVIVEEYASGPLRAGDDLVINVFVPVK
jgi:effector-binding domain-containing protein